jgi:hypothetical protein
MRGPLPLESGQIASGCHLMALNVSVPSYKRGVTGSNPVAPTTKYQFRVVIWVWPGCAEDRLTVI